MSAEWRATTPSSGVVRGQAFTRHGLVTTHRRGTQGVVFRLPEGGKHEYKSCGHAHQKRGLAIKCAEAWARYLNTTEES